MAPLIEKSRVKKTVTAALVALAVTSLAAPLVAPLAAQSEVRGVVTDSLRGAPLAGALVALEGTNQRTRTDERGRFTFRNVPTGSYLVNIQSPFLDSMALGALQKTIDVRRAVQEVSLATMSAAAYHRAVCGQELSADQGVVIGNATFASGNPSEGMHVAAIWNETVLATTGAQGLLRGSVDTTNIDGFFVLCGVPAEAEFQIRAGDDAMGTAVLTMPASPARVQRRDLRVGVAGSSVRIRGRLATADGTPLEGDVELVGDSTATVRTPPTGEFEVTTSERSTQLWVRVLGYVPRYVNLEPSGGELDVGDVLLEKVPAELATRLIEGRVVSQAEFEFEERRKSGAGVFLDSAALTRAPTRSVTSVASLARVARVARSGRTETLMLRKGVDLCSPRVFVDGHFVGKTMGGRGQVYIDAQQLAEFLRTAKRIEFYVAAYAPPAYPDFDGCGVVLIWLR